MGTTHRKRMYFAFDVDQTFHIGIKRLEKVLDFKQGEGISVTAVQGERSGVTLKDGKAVIYYPKKHLFFRQLGVLVEHARHETAFELFEDTFFETVSAMIDTSRCAVPTFLTVSRLLDYFAVMGYGMAMLYTEDTVQLENYKYFGYMRGRYTQAELREMDDYADAYGIEMIPCLECYGHMGKYLIWGEAAPIKDTANVLMAREEKTFEFLDELIGTVSSCFRSKRIHIGMDEAWDMGRGKFMDQHGYVPPFDIFNEYMDRLMAIIDKYGLQAMMWSDMYFRINEPNSLYYEEETVVPPEVAAKIPENVELIFWHYGEKDRCDDYMLKKHTALGRKVIFAGGLWSWIGHFPEHNYAMETTRFSLDACRNNGVREAMMTLWLNDNAECDVFANLFGLSFFAELCYDKDASEEKLRARFESTTRGDYDAFYTMSLYHNKFEGETYENYSNRFLGKPLFWQDIMEGLYDTHLENRPMSGHYAACARKMQAYGGGRWSYLYDFAYRVFEYLAVKTEIAEKLVPAYRAGDRSVLMDIAQRLLPLLKDKTVQVHEAHKAMWFDNLKVIGWSNLDIRYGGMAARCDTAKMTIERYLSGTDEVIGELEEVRLHKPLSGFVAYSAISSPNLKI